MLLDNKSVSNGISCAPRGELNWPSVSPPKYELEQGRLTFSGSFQNASDATITTLSWPVLGDLVPPDNTDFLYRENFDYGTMKRTPLWPHTGNERGYYGTNYPMQIEGKGSLLPGIPGAYHFPQRFVLLGARTQGIYIAVHDTSARQMVCFQSELRPGYQDSFHALSPDLTNIGETPVHLTVESVHYPMAAPGETIELPDIVVEPYLGDWHGGLDIYRRWRETWYQRQQAPSGFTMSIPGNKSKSDPPRTTCGHGSTICRPEPVNWPIMV